jgi:curved DNA-binding protein
MARDYYQVLGVNRTASAEELQRAFRTLARRNHPDVNKDPAAEERFKEINEAYHVLADPKTRERYDRFGPDFRQIPEGAESAAGSHARSSGFGRAAGSGTRIWVDGDESDFGINIDELFGGLFGGRRGRGPIRGADQEVELQLTVEEAYRGGRRSIDVAGRSFDVTIPPGVIHGQRIRLAGQGGTGGRGGPAGDLHLIVRIAPHQRYRLHGRDIHVQAPVTPWDAALGASIPVMTPGGEVKVRVPAGSSSGRRLRLAGEGMPNPRGQPGDLYAEVRIVLPPKLSRKERDLFKQLASISTFDPRSDPRSAE